MKVKVLLLSFFVLLGCAQVTSLNLKKHQFGRIPTKIVWIQVAGLSMEHLSMLKFSYPSRKQKTAFENSLCIGNSWEYNLFKIRPTAYNSFLSQLTGKKNIKNSCEDYGNKPIWKYIHKQGYRIGIFEGENYKKESLLQSYECSEHSNFLKEASFWSMNKSTEKLTSYFHANTKTNYKSNTTYYDKSCLSGDCFTTLSRNVESVFKQYNKNAKNYLFIVRDFSFKRSLLKRNTKETIENLQQLSSVLNYFQKLAAKSNDMLVLLTTAESREVDFPKSGNQWKKFENRKVKMNTKNSKLVSTVFATGARAENFCGIYDQSQIMARIFSGAKQQGLEFSIINPFE